MRFRWSLGALLPKQAKLGRADASGKLQSLSRSTKLELMKVGDHIWPWWPLQQWYPVPCLTLTCQKVLSAFIFVGMGQMGECPKEIVFAPQIIMRITMMVVVDGPCCMVVQGFSLKVKAPDQRDKWRLTASCIMLPTLCTLHGLHPLQEGAPFANWHSLLRKWHALPLASFQREWVFLTLTKMPYELVVAPQYYL